MLRKECVDDTGNIYISVSIGIRKIDTFGIITTVAGTGLGGSTGDGGLAINAQVSTRQPIVDKIGNIYFTEGNFHKVRKIDPQGIITTFAGTGVQGYSGDGGPAINSQMNWVGGISLDSCGNVYISEAWGFRIRKVSVNPNCFPLSITALLPLTFTLSPNPTTSQLTITSDTKLNAVIVSSMPGQVVLRQRPNGHKAILDTRSLPPGIYFVKVEDVNGQTRTEKVVKE